MYTDRSAGFQRFQPALRIQRRPSLDETAFVIVDVSWGSVESFPGSAFTCVKAITRIQAAAPGELN